jgi:hypothetical protein
MQSPDDLPEPDGLLAHEGGSAFADCYTAEQMRAYRAEGVAQERERCAKLCESLFDADDDSCNEAEKCAAAIRAGHTTS